MKKCLLVIVSDEGINSIIAVVNPDDSHSCIHAICEFMETGSVDLQPGVTIYQIVVVFQDQIICVHDDGPYCPGPGLSF